MCETPSAQSWIVILSQTSSRSRFANIDATKLRRLFCTDRFRLRRRYPKKRRHFAAGEEARHAIVFQGRQGSKQTIIRQTCGEVGENHVNDETLFNQKHRSACQRPGCHSAANCAERFGIRPTRKTRTRCRTTAKTQRRTRGRSPEPEEGNCGCS